MRNPMSAMLFVIAVFLSVSALAQRGPGMGSVDSARPTVIVPKNPEEIIEEEVRWMTRKLNLSDEQIVRVTRISERYTYAQLDIIYSANHGNPTRISRVNNREEFGTKLKDLSLGKDSEMQSVLSSKQFKKYLKNRRELGSTEVSRTMGGYPPENRRGRVVF